MAQTLPPLILPTHAPGNPTSPNQGPPGPQGPIGPPGPPGPNGVTATQPISPGNIKNCISGVPVSLLQIDMNNTISSDHLFPDNSFACKVFFAAETTDGNDVQIRQGDCNAAAAYKADVFTTSQATNVTSAITTGTFTTIFTWSTSGTVATLQVTVTTSLALPSDIEFHYFVLHATHPAFVYL